MSRRALILALGWAFVATVVWLSLTPSPPRIDLDQGDKLGHLLAYGTLMYWFCQLYPRGRTRVIYAAGFILMGVLLEFIQGATGYRNFELLDMGANALGVGIGWGIGAVVPGRFFAQIRRSRRN